MSRREPWMVTPEEETREFLEELEGRAEKAEARVRELETCLRAWDALFVWDPFEGYAEEFALHVVFHRADVPSVSGTTETPCPDTSPHSSSSTPSSGSARRSSSAGTSDGASAIGEQCPSEARREEDRRALRREAHEQWEFIETVTANRTAKAVTPCPDGRHFFNGDVCWRCHANFGAPEDLPPGRRAEDVCSRGALYCVLDHEREPGDCHDEDGKPAKCLRCSAGVVSAYHENGARCPRATHEAHAEPVRDPKEEP